MRRFTVKRPKRHSAIQAAGAAVLGAGVWAQFGAGWAAIAVGVLVILAGVADEVG